MPRYQDASILVLGASGMLGREVCAELDRRKLTYHHPRHADVDITVPSHLSWVMQRTKSAVINCAGAIPPRHYSMQKMINTNGLAPHLIAKEADKLGLRVIHVSTDCVFGGHGDGQPHTVTVTPNPVDVYGRSKLLGESPLPHVSNVRTSFIGLRHGLLRWAMESKGREVEGWMSALWSGSTVYAVARGLVRIALGEVGDSDANIIHLATDSPISKAAVLGLLNDAFHLDLTIHPTTQPYIDRSLVPTVSLPPLRDCLPELVQAAGLP